MYSVFLTLSMAFTVATGKGKGRHSVTGVVGHTADIPCEVTPFSPTDSPYLILWYKDIFGTPIYSFDMRNDLTGRHWMERKTLDDRATFHLEKTGQKTKDGVQILSAFLRIEKLKKSDAGPYRCRVDFRQAPTRNVKVKLDLIELPSPPQIITDDGTLISGDHSPPMKMDSSLVLTCEAKGGSPLPSLSWWRQTNSSVRVSLVSDSSMTEKDKDGTRVKSVIRLDSLKRGDLGHTIGCRATNNEMTEPLETSFKINMLLPPVLVRIVREWSYLLAGKSYNVSCQVQGSNPPAYTKAFIGGKELKVADYEMNSSGDVSTTRIAFVPSIDDHGAFLACRAENPHLPENNAVEDQWRIEVQYTPRAELSLSEYRATKVEINEGEQIKLKCSVNANPNLHAVHWRRNGLPIDSSGSPMSRRSNVVEALQTETTFFNLESIKPEESGNYTCVGENMLGVGISNRLQVLVKYRPKCQRSGVVLWYSALRESIDLPCKVNAFPTQNIKYHWRFIKDNGETTEVRSRISVDGKAEDNGSVLTYQADSMQDFGKVECLALNEAGEQEEPCRFEIRPKGLPSLDSCSVVSLNAGKMSINCKIQSKDQKEINEEMEVRIRVISIETETNSMVSNLTYGISDKAMVIPHLEEGKQYKLKITTLVPSLGLELLKPLEIIVETAKSVTSNEELVIAVVEAYTPATTMIPINDPIRLVPIIGILSIVVIVLVLVAVVIVVIMRSRGFSQTEDADDIDSNLKTHVGFNRSLDVGIDKSGENKQLGIDKEILKNLETISRMDSYEKLNDVKFEGFSTTERRRLSSSDSKYLPQASSRRSSSLVVESDFSSGVREVPVGALCILEDPSSPAGVTTQVAGYAYLQLAAAPNQQMEEHSPYIPSTSEHFPFREAIPAPIAIRRISQVSSGDTIMTTPLISEDPVSPNEVWPNSSPALATPTTTSPRVTFAMDKQEDKKMEYLL